MQDDCLQWASLGTINSASPFEKQTISYSYLKAPPIIGWCLFRRGHDMVKGNLVRWHKAIETQDTSLLSDLLDDNVVFYSPVVHRPQEGKAVTFLYLSAAFTVLAGDQFEYTGEYCSENGAVLEFKTELEGIEINGIDMITWNEQGKICEFKVMLRPLKAVNKVHELMANMLERMAS